MPERIVTGANGRKHITTEPLLHPQRGSLTREQANAILARNPGVIASFSRALTEGLSVNQSDDAFDHALERDGLGVGICASASRR